MLKGIFRKKDKAALVAIDWQLKEIQRMIFALGPHIATLDALGPHIATLDALGPHIATLDALGPHIATLDALVPHIATLDALGARIAAIDRTSVALNNLDSFAHEVMSLENIAVFAGLVQQLQPIVDTYLNQNHFVAENVRVDVETVTVLITALQMQINQLQKTISDSQPK
jgi:hypothetical protein